MTCITSGCAVIGGLAKHSLRRSEYAHVNNMLGSKSRTNHIGKRQIKETQKIGQTLFHGDKTVPPPASLPLVPPAAAAPAPGPMWKRRGGARICEINYYALLLGLKVRRSRCARRHCAWLTNQRDSNRCCAPQSALGQICDRSLVVASDDCRNWQVARML